METIAAIENRRSIRRFIDKEIDKNIIEKIMEAGILAPSGKNAQPWKYIVVTGKNKTEMLKAMKEGIENEKSGNGILIPHKQLNIAAEYTMKIMEEAPITIFVINTEGKIQLTQTIEEKLEEMVNIQSIGASIQNMLLAAFDYGIGSLWICDIYFAYRGLSKWLNTDQQIIAAISFGYANEEPLARPRKKMEEVVEWR
ncbi:MAG: nitroreductase [Treponema sp.]|jgi:nitroreductase|nr:nitroreductase [Treponema sp.]